MITVTQTFKDNLHGPKTWWLQLSAEGSTWEDITWQDAPVGSEFVRPLGSLQQMTEDPQPFSFVGPDMQLSARNTTGFWTNAGSTGRLDTGTTVFVRVQTGIAADTGNYITLLAGPVDLATIQKEPGDLVSFTVRGTLNALDYKLAAEYCANRQFSTGYFSFPVKFMDWLLVKPAGGPDGTYLLKYDSSKQTLSWDGGVAVKIVEQAEGFLLTGESGNVIECIYSPGGWQNQAGLPNEDVEQWMVYKDGILYDSTPASSLDEFKNKVATIVDVDVSSIPGLTLTGGEPGIYHFEGLSDMYPAAVIGVADKTWLVSSYSGAYKGIWKVQLLGDDPMANPVMSKLSDSVACKMKKIGTDILCLCDTSTANDAFLASAFISSYTFLKFDSSLAITTYAVTQYPMAWRSLDFYTNAIAYCVVHTSGNNGQIDSLTFTTNTWAAKGNVFVIAGMSLLPGCVVNLPGDAYYVCYAGYIPSSTVVTSIEIWSVGWHITNSLFALSVLDISADIAEGRGPVQCVPTVIEVSDPHQHLPAYSGVMLLLDKIHMQQGSGATWFYSNKRLVTGGDVYAINYSQQSATIQYGEVQDFYVFLNGGQNYLYCPLIQTNVVGKTLAFTSGTNNGETKAISAQAVVQQIVSGPGGSQFIVICTKLSFGTNFTAAIDAGDDFKIYSTGVVLASSGISEIDELDGTTLLESKVSFIRGKYFDTLSYVNYETWYASLRVGELGKLSGLVLAEVLAHTNPRCIAADGSGKFLSCGRTGYVFVDYIGATTMERQVSNNLWDNKTVREAVEELATHCNAYLFPSEHSRKLTLQYRGTTPEAVYGITRDKYHYDGLWSPRLPVDQMTLDGERMGVIKADKFGQSLALSSPQTNPSNRKSLANDIWTYLSQSRRWHRIVSDWLIWHEPGDTVKFDVDDSTGKDCMVVSTETDPESLTHALTLLEEA